MDLSDAALVAYWREWTAMYGSSDGSDASKKGSEAYWDIVDAISATMTRAEPSVAVQLLIRLVDAAPSEEALCFAGAGPFEELLFYGGRTDIPRVVGLLEAAATADPRFAFALSSAWYDSHLPAELTSRLRRFGMPS